MSERHGARVAASLEDNAKPRFVSSLQSLSRASSAFVVVVGVVVLLGWGYQVELLEGRARGYVGMNPTTALVLMLAAAALWTQHRVWRASSRSMLLRCAVGTAAVIVVAVGVITLAGYVLGRHLGLDQIAFRTRLVGNRIAPNTGLNFVLVGVALWLLDRPPRWRRLHAEVTALLVIGISGVSLLGYGYGVARMYSVGQFIPMALPTALSFFALGVGVVCARPDHGFASMLSREDAGGVLARRVLPAAILIPAALGWFRVWGHRAGFFDEEQGVAIVVVLTIFALVTFIAVTARSLSEADRVRSISKQHSATQYLTTRVLVESATIGEAMPRILEVICQRLDWVMGVRWSIDSDGGALRCQEMWLAPGRTLQELVDINRLIAFERGIGLPGRVWSTGRAAWIADVTRDSNFPRTDAAAQGGLHGAFAFSIIGPSGFLGVMEFFSTEVRPPEEAILRLFEGLGGQVGQFIERKQAEAELERAKIAAEAATQAKSDFLANMSQALEQQTATSEILRTIAHSQTDVQPVFDTIVSSAARLCNAANAAVFLTDGTMVYNPANYESSPETLAAIGAQFPRPLDNDTIPGMAILARCVVHVPDIEDVSAVESVRQSGRVLGFRSTAVVPMLREGEAVGAIGVGRREPGRFSDTEVELLKTFAAQAVIAIENVRLFTELRERTAQLGRSVEELTALGQVSQAFSSTLDVETVLTTIVQRAIELSAADGGAVYEYDDAAEEFRVRVTQNFEEELVEASRAMPTRRGEGALGMVAERREPIQFANISDRTVYQSRVRDVLLRTGYRAILAVPLLRHDRIVGGLVIGRKSAGEFSSRVIDLLTTFANQSALAIQNARLFRELADKSRQLEFASRHKSEFLANVSHELRTPMNAILGFNELILGGIYGEVSPALKVPLTDIQNSGKHLLRLINNVLDLSKIEAGRMELALGDYWVQDTVERVEASLRSLAAEKGLDFGIAVPEGIPLAHGDAGRITQCLMNLAGNALKFTRHGRVEISVDCRGDVLTYRVTDTGIGIPKDRLETVFSEFRQGDPTITSEFGGTGLGLSITKKFVGMHGGRIWVESELGKGSTFAFEIPLCVKG